MNDLYSPEYNQSIFVPTKKDKFLFQDRITAFQEFLSFLQLILFYLLSNSVSNWKLLRTFHNLFFDGKEELKYKTNYW